MRLGGASDSEEGSSRGPRLSAEGEERAYGAVRMPGRRALLAWPGGVALMTLPAPHVRGAPCEFQVDHPAGSAGGWRHTRAAHVPCVLVFSRAAAKCGGVESGAAQERGRPRAGRKALFGSLCRRSPAQRVVTRRKRLRGRAWPRKLCHSVVLPTSLARCPGAGQCSTIAVCRPAARVQGAVCAHMLRELCWWLCRARCCPGDPATSACVRAHLCANRECEVDRRTGPDCGGLPAAVARHTCSLRPHYGLAHRRGAAPGRAGAAGGQLPVRGPAPGLSAGRGARVQGRGRLRRPGRVHGPRQPGWCVRAAGPRRRAEGTPVTDSSLSPHTAQTCAACPPARCPSCRSRPARCPRRVGCAGRPGAAGRDAGSFAGPVAPSQLPVPAHSRTRCACATRPRRRLWPPARPRSPRRGRRWPASPGRCEVPPARLLTTPPTPHTRRHVPVFLHACTHADRVPGPDQGRAAPDAG